MDYGYLKAFIITGVICCICSIIRYGPRRFFEGKHPFQAAFALFILGGLGGILFYPLIMKMGSHWRFWKWQVVAVPPDSSLHIYSAIVALMSSR